MICLTIPQKRKPGAGDGKRQRVYFVEAENITGAAETRGDSGAESDDGHADGSLALQVTHGAAHAGERAVVAGGLIASFGVQKLGAVIDGAVDQAADCGIFFVPGNIANPQDAVEVANREAKNFIGAILFVADMN